MKLEDLTDASERRVLRWMAMRPNILRQIAAKWSDDSDWFNSPYANLIGSWCVHYYRQSNGKVPRAGGLQAMFQSWAEKNQSEEALSLVERLVISVIENKEPSACDEITLDQAANHFYKNQVKALLRKIKEATDAGHINKVEGLIANFRRVDLGAGSWSEFFDDLESHSTTFVMEDAMKDLIEYPGDLGKFFKGTLTRDSLVAFLAPTKAGKTWWLVDLAYRAYLNRCRTLFIEVGDLSQRQICLRFACRNAARPYLSRSGWPMNVQYPINIKAPVRSAEGDEAIAQVRFKVKTYKRALDADTSWAKVEEVRSKKLRSKKCYFRLLSYPNFSIHIGDIKTIVGTMVSQGWAPDVVVIDYADLLMPPPGSRKEEGRDAINRTWMLMRQLSQEFHCLVATATQANAKSFAQRLLNRGNFSEDVRKLQHATGVVGINTTNPEKEDGISRLNWIVLREGEYNPMRCVHVAGCLAIGNPAILSTF